MALGVVLLAAEIGASAPEVIDGAQRERARNDLNVLIETARLAWAYAEDKQEHFEVNLQRLLTNGMAALGGCRTKREVLELFRETVAELKDGHAGLNHPELRRNQILGTLPHRLVDTKDGVVLGKDLVVLWNGQPMEDQIRLASKSTCASTPGMRRMLALRSLETSGSNDAVRVTLRRADGQVIQTNLVYNQSRNKTPFIEFRWLTNQVACIRLTSFRAETAAPEADQGPKDPSGHAIAALEAAKAKISAAFSNAANARCLILDLRGNMGGTDLLGSHVALHLVPGAFTYFKLQTRNSPQLRAVAGFEKHPASGWSPASEWGPPRPVSVTAFPGLIFILQDQLCFSTTDNLLACLQDLLPANRVRFIGRPSGGGTGAPRALATLPWTGATVTLTVMKVLSPKGRLIEGRGTIPNRALQWTWKDLLEERDVDLECALNEGLRLSRMPLAVPAAINKEDHTR
jgi:C-terminal processing protease CtpA/Prc